MTQPALDTSSTAPTLSSGDVPNSDGRHRKTLKTWLMEDIELHPRIDLILLVMAFASAMVDVMTVPLLGTFVANSTGNILFLGMGAAQLSSRFPDLVNPRRAGLAVGMYFVGAFVVGRLGRWVGEKRRAWLMGWFAFEALLVFVTVILLYTIAIRVEDETNLVAVFLLSWAFGTQGVVCKGLGVKAIVMPQVVTGAMGDLWADPNVFRLHNTMRNQRAALLVVFFIGALIAGFAIKVNGELVLLLTAVFKLVAAGLFAFVPGKKVERVGGKEKEVV